MGLFFKKIFWVNYSYKYIKFIIVYYVKIYGVRCISIIIVLFFIFYILFYNLMLYIFNFN